MEQEAGPGNPTHPDKRDAWHLDDPHGDYSWLCEINQYVGAETAPDPELDLKTDPSPVRDWQTASEDPLPPSDHGELGEFPDSTRDLDLIRDIPTSTHSAGQTQDFPSQFEGIHNASIDIDWNRPAPLAPQPDYPAPVAWISTYDVRLTRYNEAAGVTVSDINADQNEKTQPVKINQISDPQPSTDGLPAWLEGLENELPPVADNSPAETAGIKNEELFIEQTQPVRKADDPTAVPASEWTVQGTPGDKNAEIQAAQTNMLEPEDSTGSEVDFSSPVPPSMVLEENLRQLRRELAARLPASQIARELLHLTEQHPENPVLWLALGDIRARNNETQSALEAYEKASALINTPASGE